MASLAEHLGHFNTKCGQVYQKFVQGQGTRKAISILAKELQVTEGHSIAKKKCKKSHTYLVF